MNKFCITNALLYFSPTLWVLATPLPSSTGYTPTIWSWLHPYPLDLATSLPFGPGYTPTLWVAVQNRGSRCKTCIRVHKGKIFLEYCENFDQKFLQGN
jgi:hypothetical protein